MATRLLQCLAAATLLSVAACSGSDSGSGPEEEADFAHIKSDPLIYTITNADGEAEGWLFGTIHALPASADWQSSKVNALIEDADLLIVEVAELDDQAALAALFADLSTTPGTGPLKDRIDPALHGDLGQMLERSNYGPDDFASVEDWAAAIMLARVDAVGHPALGVDKALIKEFEPSEVIGLETAQGQLGIFDTLAREDQQALLEGTIREWSASRRHPQRLTKAWLKGDIAVLEDISTGGIMADPEIRAALLTNRNDAWIEPIEQALEQEPLPLIAVGTAHLIGPEGLAAQLEARGYTVTRAH